MKKGRTHAYARALLSLALLTAVFLLGYHFGGWGQHAHETGTVHEHVAHEEDGHVVWTCSMHPQIRLPEPGKCPICFMDLIPLSQDAGSSDREAVSLRQITLSPEARKLAEVEVFPVERRAVTVEIPLFGKVDYDETRVRAITTWTAGRIDKLHIDYTGSFVRKGDPVVSIYSPELLTAQTELIQAVKAVQEIDKSGLRRVRDAVDQTVLAAKEKLRLLGLTADQIQKIVDRASPSDHITLHSPMEGVVTRKNVLEGMYVQTGTQIFTIADLSRVWIMLEAYESDLPWLHPGTEVAFQTRAHPGEIFRGKAIYVDPMVNEETRTVRVRLEAPNPAGKLKPGMFVQALSQARRTSGKEPLVIPASAPLITGKRAIVYVQVPEQEGAYEGKEIVLGPRAGAFYIVRQGLSEGERVVTRGNFKIDSAVQLLAKPSMMSPYSGAGVAAHDHGSKTPATEDRPTPSPDLPPPAFASQLFALAKIYDTLKAVVDQRDLQKTRETYQTFHDLLSGTDPSSLQDQPALVWKEAGMLLRNDAMLGTHADTHEEAARIFETLTNHYRIIQDTFHVELMLEARAVFESVPLGFKRSLGELLRSYLDIQDPLAHDNFSSAKKAGDRFASSLKKMDTGLLSGDARTVWMEALRMLERGVNGITGARDMETARKGFEPLSMGMTLAVERLGVDITGPVFELYCPMAFDWKGAAWLQQDEAIRNPYFGDMMYRCGEVKRVLKSG